MKRCVLLITFFAVLISVCGCAKIQETDTSVATFYYLSSKLSYGTQEGVLSPELRDIQAYEDDILGLLNFYLAGPESDSLISPFPTYSSAERYTQSGNTLKIYMNYRFCTLSGLSLTIACACLARTVLSLYNCDAVSLYAPLAFKDGSTFITFTKDNLIFSDTV